MFGTERIVIAFGELADAWKECIEELSEYGRMMANEYPPGIFIGKRIDCYYTESNTDGRGPSERHYHATYEYMVNGMKKKKKVTAREFKPPIELEIYYVEPPRKVFTEYDLKVSPLQLLIYIIPLVVGVWVARMLGA